MWSLACRSLTQKLVVAPSSAVISQSKEVIANRVLHSFHSTALRSLPVRTVQLISLGDDDEENNNKSNCAIISSIMRTYNDSVRVGDVLALVETKFQDQQQPSQNLPIISPFAGKITSWHVNERDTVAQGDDLCSIDVQENETAMYTKNRYLKPIVDHLRNNGTFGQRVDATLFQDFLAAASVDDLRQVANMMITLHRQGDEFESAQDHRIPLNPQLLSLFERMLQLQEESGATQERIMTLSDMAGILLQLGDVSMAILYLQQALELKERNQTTPQEIAMTRLRLASMLQRNRQPDEAITQVQTAQALLEDLKNDHTALEQVARSYHLLGALYGQKGDIEASIQAHQRGLDRNLHLHGTDTPHADTATSFQYLADALAQKPDFPKSIESYQQAIKQRYAINADHIDTVRTHASLGQILAVVDELEAATEQYTAALDMILKLTKNNANSSPQFKNGHDILAATIYRQRGTVWYQQRIFDFALNDHQKARDLLQSALGDKHPEVADSLNLIGLALCQKGEWEKALESHSAALEILVSVLGDAHPHLATTHGAIGNALKGLGRLEDALKEFKAAHDMLLRTGNQPDIASSHNNLGLILQQLNQPDQALTEFRAAQALFASSLGPQHAHTGSCHYNMALALQEQDNQVNAQKEFERARDVWYASLGADHPQTKMAEEAIQRLKISLAK